MMAKLRIEDRIRELGEKLDSSFERWARNPRVLGLAGHTLNEWARLRKRRIRRLEQLEAKSK